MNTNQENSAVNLGNSECEGCKQCRQALQIVLDEEATPEEIEFVHQHINTCTHCFECYQVDKTLRQMVREKFNLINVPNDLVQIIQVKVNELTIKA